LLHRTRTAAVFTLALLNVFTLSAGVVVAHMLPPRLAALRIPETASGPVLKAAPVLAPAQTQATLASAGLPTAAALGAMLGAALPKSATGPGVGIEVADAQTGQVLYADNDAALATPASTTKVMTAAAALATLGPDARFATTVRQQGGTIVLVGGGDPTLAVNAYPSYDYPRPATLAALAAGTARALKAQGRNSVRLGYDISLYTGPALAPGWSGSLVTTGNVTPIVSLEADQGRLAANGAFQDDDDPINYSARTTDPAGMTAAAFASLLRQDGITVTGTPAETAAMASAPKIASVSSPTLASIEEQMLLESNNVIAENLARHVAIALGMPASFSGAADAVMTEARRLGVTTPMHLVDGSGLSPEDGIAPETLVRVLALAASRPQLRTVITGLPVAGFLGTLSAGDSDFGAIAGLGGGAARGVVRAKTGNLGTVADLAGIAYAADGRLLLFAIMAPQVPGAGSLPRAAAAIDSAAAGLARCGCR
jgi:D-alanyl-D-alanine carboxypeptidase/D-alanyl-D-alanine-endopeptidase (penicillin-binding protein 4)